MRRFVGLVVLAAAAACSSGKGGGGNTDDTADAGSGSDAGSVTLMAGFDPGPAPDPSQGFQIITPIVDDIEPGASDEYCTYTNVIMQQDTWLKASSENQTEGGHHVIFYYTTDPQPPSTHLCSNAEMTDFQFGMPGAPKGQKFTLPGDLAVLIPKGAQIVVNHHYLNAGAQAIPQAQSSIDVFYADQSTPHTESSVMVVLDSSLSVPPGASTYTVTCTINRSYQAWSVIPHMHNWGTHITVDDTPAGGGATQRLFDIDWDPDYAFDFEAVEMQKSPTAPFVFNAGDQIKIACDYLNNGSSTLSFGDEMCLLVSFTVDPNAIGNVQCDRGQWGTF